MREKLNESKAAQGGLFVVLVIVAAVLLLGKGGGGESTEASGEETAVTGEAVAVSTATAATGGAGELPTSVPPTQPLPKRFIAAYDADQTVALLVVHDGGIDDKYTKKALREAAAIEDAAVIVVPAKQIYRYASVTVGLDVSQLPALVVMRPKSLSHGVPQATVSYGYQTVQSIGQALRDASYAGPEEGTYHPG